MKLVQYPHPALRHKAEPVTTISKELHLQVGEMLHLMYTNEGLGLAAPQIAVPNRVLVMNFAGDPEQKDQEFVAINPVILEMKGTIDDREGCLSFPDLFAKVRRAKSVRVQAYNLKGELYEMTVNDLPARIWQHEVDHLEGVLFIDKMGMLGRLNSKRAIEEFIHEFNEAKAKGTLPKEMEPKF
ncbi:MAG: peptide deformylase [Planctomycetes bacterium]|nr:peptide deformylase [Planctomycetota bacterium]